MTSNANARPKRKRRIASDEAHAWARNLRLRNPYAKSVLRALCIYADENGACIPGISTIADDTDLSQDTVRKRLKFLEDVGAIVRFPRWLDEQGRSNSDGRGKRTTDEIRLMIESDPEDIEARACGEDPDSDVETIDAPEEFSPRQQQGLNPDDEPASPRQKQGLQDSASPEPALGQPSHSSKGLISLNHEPESSPKPPSGVVCDGDDDQTPEHFAEFFDTYPDHRLMSRSKALEIFRLLPADEQLLARAAVVHYAAELAKARRRPFDAHKWLKEKRFSEYPYAKLPEKPKERRFIEESELANLAKAYAIAGISMPRVLVDGRYGVWRVGDLPADLRALAAIDPAERGDWVDVVEHSPQYAAWRDRLSAWTGFEVRPVKIFEEERIPQHSLPASHPDFKLPKRTYGLRVPWPWPPRKDGTLSNDANGGESEHAA